MINSEIFRKDFFKGVSIQKNLREQYIKVLCFLAYTNPNLTPQQLADLFGLHLCTIKDYLHYLPILIPEMPQIREEVHQAVYENFVKPPLDQFIALAKQLRPELLMLSPEDIGKIFGSFNIDEKITPEMVSNVRFGAILSSPPLEWMDNCSRTPNADKNEPFNRQKTTHSTEENQND